MESSWSMWRKWLGLPPGDEAPDYYELLELPRFDSDKDRIRDRAAEQQRKVRPYQAGIQFEQADRLLTFLGRAKTQLLDPKKKATYDRTLSEKLGVPLPGPGNPASLPAMPGPSPEPQALPPAAEPLPAAGPGSYGAIPPPPAPPISRVGTIPAPSAGMPPSGGPGDALPPSALPTAVDDPNAAWGVNSALAPPSAPAYAPPTLAPPAPALAPLPGTWGQDDAAGAWNTNSALEPPGGSLPPPPSVGIGAPAGSFLPATPPAASASAASASAASGSAVPAPPVAAADDDDDGYMRDSLLEAAEHKIHVISTSFKGTVELSEAAEEEELTSTRFAPPGLAEQFSTSPPPEEFAGAAAPHEEFAGAGAAAPHEEFAGAAAPAEEFAPTGEVAPDAAAAPRAAPPTDEASLPPDGVGEWAEPAADTAEATLEYAGPVTGSVPSPASFAGAVPSPESASAAEPVAPPPSAAQGPAPAVDPAAAQAWSGPQHFQPGHDPGAYSDHGGYSDPSAYAEHSAYDQGSYAGPYPPGYVAPGYGGQMSWVADPNQPAGWVADPNRPGQWLADPNQPAGWVAVPHAPGGYPPSDPSASGIQTQHPFAGGYPPPDPSASGIQTQHPYAGGAGHWATNPGYDPGRQSYEEPSVSQQDMSVWSYHNPNADWSQYGHGVHRGSVDEYSRNSGGGPPGQFGWDGQSQHYPSWSASGEYGPAGQGGDPQAVGGYPQPMPAGQYGPDGHWYGSGVFPPDYQAWHQGYGTNLQGYDPNASGYADPNASGYPNPAAGHYGYPYPYDASGSAPYAHPASGSDPQPAPGDWGGGPIVNPGSQGSYGGSQGSYGGSQAVSHSLSNTGSDTGSGSNLGAHPVPVSGSAPSAGSNSGSYVIPQPVASSGGDSGERNRPEMSGAYPVMVPGVPLPGLDGPPPSGMVTRPDIKPALLPWQTGPDSPILPVPNAGPVAGPGHSTVGQAPASSADGGPSATGRQPASGPIVSASRMGQTTTYHIGTPPDGSPTGGQSSVARSASIDTTTMLPSSASRVAPRAAEQPEARIFKATHEDVGPPPTPAEQPLGGQGLYKRTFEDDAPAAAPAVPPPTLPPAPTAPASTSAPVSRGPQHINTTQDYTPGRSSSDSVGDDGGSRIRIGVQDVAQSESSLQGRGTVIDAGAAPPPRPGGGSGSADPRHANSISAIMAQGPGSPLPPAAPGAATVSGSGITPAPTSRAAPPSENAWTNDPHDPRLSQSGGSGSYDAVRRTPATPPSTPSPQTPGAQSPPTIVRGVPAVPGGGRPAGGGAHARRSDQVLRMGTIVVIGMIVLGAIADWALSKRPGNPTVEPDPVDLVAQTVPPGEALPTVVPAAVPSEGPAQRLAASPDGSWLLIGRKDATDCLHTYSGGFRRRFPWPLGPLTAFRTDGRWFVTGPTTLKPGDQRMFLAVDLASTEQPLRIIPTNLDRPGGIFFDPDGRSVRILGEHHSLKKDTPAPADRLVRAPTGHWQAVEAGEAVEFSSSEGAYLSKAVGRLAEIGADGHLVLLRHDGKTACFEPRTGREQGTRQAGTVRLHARLPALLSETTEGDSKVWQVQDLRTGTTRVVPWLKGAADAVWLPSGRIAGLLGESVRIGAKDDAEPAAELTAVAGEDWIAVAGKAGILATDRARAAAEFRQGNAPLTGDKLRDLVRPQETIRELVRLVAVP